MSTATPGRLTIAKPVKNSVAPQTLKNRSNPPVISSPKGAPPRLKVVIRRLAPGLTEEEFKAAIGDEWKLENGYIDWMSYKPGKISREPAKPSRPSRAYLHLTKQEYLPQLSEKARETNFADARNSGNDSVLLGPPSVEFAPYGRVPNPKARKDARQGTLDQDPEFIDFLESLTNPSAKAVPLEGSAKDSKEAEVPKVTPLIQFLRDKKANKHKEGAAAKASKHARQDSKDPKLGQSIDKKLATKNGKVTSPIIEKRSPAAIKVEKLARDTVNTLNKQAHIKNGKSTELASVAPSTVVTAAAAQVTVTPQVKSIERRRERGSLSAAARMVQRDLGLTGAGPARKRRDGTTSGTTATTPKPDGAGQEESSAVKSVDKTQRSSTSTPTTTSSVSTPQTPELPKIYADANPSAKPAISTASPRPKIPGASKAVSASMSASTAAFLKHANPSQGITEALLHSTFGKFGTITTVEIDKKKGFAYIDFTEPEGLQKAIAASPVKIAQGQVVVLERKPGTTLPGRSTKGTGGNTANSNRGARGGNTRGRGQGRSGTSSKSGLETRASTSRSTGDVSQTPTSATAASISTIPSTLDPAITTQAPW